MGTPFGFSPAQRLLRPAEFQAVFDQTVIKVGESQFLLLSKPNELERPRLGLAIAKKKVRRAVDRNRIKRAIRESFRLNQAALPAMDIVFLARTDLGLLSGAELRAALHQAWKRLQRKAKSSTLGGGGL